MTARYSEEIAIEQVRSEFSVKFGFEPQLSEKTGEWKMKRQHNFFMFRMMERKSCSHPKLEEFLTLAAGAILLHFQKPFSNNSELLEKMEMK